MLFDAMDEKTRIVEVYDKVVTYKFQDGQAYRVTDNGALVSTDYNTAMLEIEQYKERDGRHYKHDLQIGGSFALNISRRKFGLLLIIGTAILAAWLYSQGYLL